METKIRSILSLVLLVPLTCGAYAQENGWQRWKKLIAWVKVCERRAAAINNEQRNIEVCTTLHERLDGQTGEVLVAAAVRHREDKEYFRVMLSPLVQIEQQIYATVFPEPAWERMQSNDKLADKGDEPNQQTFSLGLLRCPGSQFLPAGVAGCIAEVKAPPELLANLKSGGGLLVYATSATCNCKIAFPISLSGFAEAFEGPPMPTRAGHSRRSAIYIQ